MIYRIKEEVTAKKTHIKAYNLRDMMVQSGPCHANKKL